MRTRCSLCIDATVPYSPSRLFLRIVTLLVPAFTNEWLVLMAGCDPRFGYRIDYHPFFGAYLA
jgi:hypothetical protein